MSWTKPKKLKFAKMMRAYLDKTAEPSGFYHYRFQTKFGALYVSVYDSAAFRLAD